jgi:hypothetical protein
MRFAIAVCGPPMAAAIAAPVPISKPRRKELGVDEVNRFSVC